MNRHCMGGCRHSQMKSVYKTEEDELFKIKTFDHYEHFCDKCPAQYEQWWKDNGDKKANDAYDCDCFEPTEIVASLDNLNNLAQSILDKLNEKGKSEVKPQISELTDKCKDFVKPYMAEND